MLAWKTKGTQLYQELARNAHQDIKPCEAYTVRPDNYKTPEGDFISWKKTNQK